MPWPPVISEQGDQGDNLVSTMSPFDANVLQRLHALSCKVGQTPEIILEEALDDYERKLLSKGCRSMTPSASDEAELLDDVGRIRVTPHASSQVLAQVVSIPRKPLRVTGEED
jgi:hypothetical protein